MNDELNVKQAIKIAALIKPYLHKYYVTNDLYGANIKVYTTVSLADPLFDEDAIEEEITDLLLSSGIKIKKEEKQS